MTGRANYDPEKRLQRDLGRAKDLLREATEIIAWQARLIDAAGIDVEPLIRRRAEILRRGAGVSPESRSADALP